MSERELLIPLASLTLSNTVGIERKLSEESNIDWWNGKHLFNKIIIFIDSISIFSWCYVDHGPAFIRSCTCTEEWLKIPLSLLSSWKITLVQCDRDDLNSNVFVHEILEIVKPFENLITSENSLTWKYMQIQIYMLEGHGLLKALLESW